MELIIGRESVSSRLMITINGTKKATYGNPNSVPSTVSRKHCRVVKNGDTYEIFNCKAENATFVNGLEINKRVFNPTTDRVELGPDKYELNILGIIRVIEQQAAPHTPPTPPTPPAVSTYSIAHLEKIWEHYHGTKLEMQIKERKSGALRSVTGIFSMSAVACGFMPGIADVPAIRIILYGLGFGLMVYFFIASYRSSAENPKILDRLDKELHAKYICPNPKCGHFIGYQPYDDLTRRNSCPHCRSNYTTKSK